MTFTEINLVIWKIGVGKEKDPLQISNILGRPLM